MNFPFDDDETTVNETVSIPKEYEIDFETGQITGRIVEGTEAIKVWSYNALKTSRYRYVILSWDYGTEIEDLIGKSHTEDYFYVEAKRMVEECLMINQYIMGIDSFKAVLNNDQLTMSFTIRSIFGEVDISV